MDESSIESMLNKTPEEIQKEAIVEKPAEEEKSSYGEEPFYKNIQFDREGVVTTTKSFTAYGQGDVTPEIEERLVAIIPLMMKCKYKMRMGGDNQNLLEAAISPLHMYKDIFLPWANANKQLAASATRKKPSEIAYRVAVNTFIGSRTEASELKFNDLPFAVKASLAKDSHILFGDNLDDKLGFIIIYTACGTTQFGKDVDFKALGRASNWIKYSKDMGIKLYNLGSVDSYNELKLILSSEAQTV